MKKRIVWLTAMMAIVVVAFGVAYQGLLIKQHRLQEESLASVSLERQGAAVLDQTLRVHADLYKAISWVSAGYDSNKVAALTAGQKKETDQLTVNLGELCRAKSLDAVQKKLCFEAEPSLKTFREWCDRVVEVVSTDPSMGIMLIESAEAAFQDLNLRMTKLMEESRRKSQEREESSQRFQALLSWVWVCTSVVIVALTVIFGFIIIRSVSQPIAAGVRVLNSISNGDLTCETPDSLRVRKDEAGDLARAIHSLTETWRRLLSHVSGGVHTLASAATELSTVSNQSAGGARAASEKSRSVAAAAEELSASSVSVASGMEEATANLSCMASATGQMKSTIDEIAKNSEKARSITADATEEARRVTDSMQELHRAAQAIGKVSETITTISDQTKLLALNATIEAARAGAAGKGFAVVAHEIKELARQTADATTDIKDKVDGIQSSATGAVKDLSRISKVIGQVSEIVNTIASAIEEQSTVTSEIARNADEALKEVKDANQQVAQISSVSQSVAKDIAAVNQAATEIASGSEQVLTSSTELSHLSEDLQRTVATFKVSKEADMAASPSSRLTVEQADTQSVKVWQPTSEPEVGRSLRPLANRHLENG